MSYVMGFKQGKSLTKSNRQEANMGLLSPKAVLPPEDPQKPVHPPLPLPCGVPLKGEGTPSDDPGKRNGFISYDLLTDPGDCRPSI